MTNPTMSTAQGDWDDQHRNHELAPKEADTAESMSAEERGKIVKETLLDDLRKVKGHGREETCARWSGNNAAEQIRQAEQAARLDAEAEKDMAYHERNQVVAALAKLFPSGVKQTDIPGWNKAWHGCVYIDLPSGQVSWHFHDSQASLFAGLSSYEGEWDGHDTPEKYERLANMKAKA